ncbi:MAG: PEP-CTERM sorting domain-containing protein [Planctomycetes bacterium]|nr:PEP-CTERM sorting domain-containing protein [Planctomycetota bacterium]
MSALVRHLAAALVFGIATSSFAGTIDTATAAPVLDTVGTRTLGQTFIATGDNLQTFGFTLQDVAGDNFVARFFVWTATGNSLNGVAGTQLFTVDVVVGATKALYTVDTGGLALTLGNAYAVGIGGVPGSDAADRVWDYNLNPDQAGHLLVRNNGAGAPGAPVLFDNNYDLGIYVVMNPEPGTLALFGLGALGLGAAVLRRRKSAVRA